MTSFGHVRQFCAVCRSATGFSCSYTRFGGDHVEKYQNAENWTFTWCLCSVRSTWKFQKLLHIMFYTQQSSLEYTIFINLATLSFRVEKWWFYKKRFVLWSTRLQILSMQRTHWANVYDKATFFIMLPKTILQQSCRIPVKSYKVAFHSMISDCCNS